MRAVGRMHPALPWLLLVGVNAIVLWNAVWHHPWIGYDVNDHLKNLQELSELRLPRREVSREFLSPPLPYLVPALLKRAGLVDTHGMRKLAQLQNALASIRLCFALLRICRLARLADPAFAAWSLALLGAEAMMWLRRREPRIYRLAPFALPLCWVHNAAIYFTH